jgi:hypothetical protein
MRHRKLEIAGALYVSFALVIAHSALAPAQATPSLYARQGSVVERVEDPVLDHQRLYQLDSSANVAEGTDDTQCRTNKSCYVIEIWTAVWCGKCPAYKERTVPALLKLGYTVVVKDWDKDAADRPKIRAVPSACIYYKGTHLRTWVAPTTSKIDRYVENRMSLKGDE